MKTWIKPAAAAENYLVNQSVSNGPCIAIACDVTAANNYERSKNLWGDRGGFNSSYQAYVNHTIGNIVDGGCGTAANNAIVVQGDKIIAMKEINNKTGTSALSCTMYTNGRYETPATNIGFVPGNTIYWTTESNYLDKGRKITRVWHHQGRIQATGTSNHS